MPLRRQLYIDIKVSVHSIRCFVCVCVCVWLCDSVSAEVYTYMPLRSQVYIE